MGKTTGFMEYERTEHYREFVIGLDDAQAQGPASRARCAKAVA